LILSTLYNLLDELTTALQNNTPQPENTVITRERSINDSEWVDIDDIEKKVLPIPEGADLLDADYFAESS
jgi:hypothetical protein